MATFAIMSGNTVTSVIMADNKEKTELALGCVLIEYTSENPAGIGCIYDYEFNRFLAPPLLPEIVAEVVSEPSSDETTTQEEVPG